MQVKGSVVKTISRFVEDEYPQQFKSWIDQLPQGSHAIYTSAIFATDWYPVKEGVILPTQVISEMFFSDPKKAAWESGKYSATLSLNGIYKVFVMISTPAFLMARARKILSSFYDPTTVDVVDSNDNSMIVHITEMPEKNTLLEYRIGGWMEGALEICGCKNLNIQITQSIANGSQLTEYNIKWD